MKILAICFLLLLVPPAQAQNKRPNLPVTVNMKGGAHQEGLFVRADNESVEIEGMSGTKIIIPTENVISIILSSESHASKSISALMAIESATEVGVSKKDYDARLIVVKTVVDSLIEKIEESTLKTEIQLALIDYQVASKAWDYMITLKTGLGVEYLPASSKLGQQLLKGYPEIFSERDFPMNQNQMLTALWNSAKMHLDLARSKLK